MNAQKPEYGTAGGLHTEQREANMQSARFFTIFFLRCRGPSIMAFLSPLQMTCPHLWRRPSCFGHRKTRFAPAPRTCVHRRHPQTEFAPQRQGRISLAPACRMPPTRPPAGPPAGGLGCPGGGAHLLGDMFPVTKETSFAGILANGSGRAGPPLR